MVDNINHREFAKIKSRGLAMVIYICHYYNTNEPDDINAACFTAWEIFKDEKSLLSLLHLLKQNRIMMQSRVFLWSFLACLRKNTLHVVVATFLLLLHIPVVAVLFFWCMCCSLQHSYVCNAFPHLAACLHQTASITRMGPLSYCEQDRLLFISPFYEIVANTCWYYCFNKLFETLLIFTLDMWNK